MIAELKQLEEQAILELAEEYRQLGYQVIVRPGESERPDFLCDCELDIIARAGLFHSRPPNFL